LGLHHPSARSASASARSISSMFATRLPRWATKKATRRHTASSAAQRVCLLPSGLYRRLWHLTRSCHPFRCGWPAGSPRSARRRGPFHSRGPRDTAGQELLAFASSPCPEGLDYAVVTAVIAMAHAQVNKRSQLSPLLDRNLNLRASNGTCEQQRRTLIGPKPSAQGSAPPPPRPPRLPRRSGAWRC
jgi:hypothetical protein